MSLLHAFASAEEELQIRIHGESSLPALIYLPGLHGDWTLVGSFRKALEGKVCFVEFTYPRTLAWSLGDYAREIEMALVRNGITRGWLLGESFGSQIVWPLAERSRKDGALFRPDGIILAGGFGKHPNPAGVYCAKQFAGILPRPCFKAGLKIYACYAKFRHRHAPETLKDISEFIARRTELDRKAMKHRLYLLGANDPSSIANKVTVPVYALSGFWDPIVPRLLTRGWLKRNCPAYRDAKTIFKADHNVLGTAPQLAAQTILHWFENQCTTTNEHE